MSFRSSDTDTLIIKQKYGLMNGQPTELYVLPEYKHDFTYLEACGAFVVAVWVAAVVFIVPEVWSWPCKLSVAVLRTDKLPESLSLLNSLSLWVQPVGSKL